MCEVACLVAGSTLDTLHEPLLREVTKYLDLHSQRNLYMTGPWLYSHWRMQTLPQDSHWHFLNWCLDQMPQMLPEDGRHGTLSYIMLELSDQRAVKVELIMAGSGYKLTMQHHVGFAHACQCMRCQQKACPSCICLTKDQVFHRLLGGPLVTRAFMHFSTPRPDSSVSLGVQQFWALAKHLLCLLGDSGHGAVQFVVDDPDDFMPCPEEENPHVIVCCDKGHWTIDGRPCLAKPPKLNLDSMPEYVKAMQLTLFNPGQFAVNRLNQVYGFLDFDSRRACKQEFAYNGNIDF